MLSTTFELSKTDYPLTTVERRMKVIMYHYVRPHTDYANNKSVLPLDVFRWQLDFFTQSGRIIHPSELFTPGFQPEPNQYLLTFDDGLIDHYTYVFPELQQRGLSGLFFLNGKNFAEQRLLNVHRLHFLVMQKDWRRLTPLVNALLQGDNIISVYRSKFEANVYENLQQEEILTDIKAKLNFYLSYAHQDEVMHSLLEYFDIEEKTVAASFYLQQNNAAAMQESGMYFGAHGYSHYVLSNLPAAEQHAELKASLQFVTDWLPAQQPPVFCYPYGYKNSYDQNSLQCLASLQVPIAFGVENRQVTLHDWQHHRLALPRLDCNRFLPD